MSVAKRPKAEEGEDEKAGAHLELLEALGQNVPRTLDIQRSRRVYVNRNLKLEEIDLIGFDMDYTLALYNQRNLETLSIRCTLDKMVQKRGYPEEILHLERGEVVSAEPPIALPSLPMQAVWHPRRTAEPRHRFYRELVMAAILERAEVSGAGA